MNAVLQTKVDRAIKLIKLAAGDSVIEVAYSGGKDSDVILELTRMAGVKYRAIYKNTTIDPPYTLKHVRDMGVEVMMPKNGVTFFKIVEKCGYPNMFHRMCCGYLKEYKVLDKVVIGIRRAESVKRASRYKEPTHCRIYSNGDKCEQILPILDWTDKDVELFLQDRQIRCAEVYYKKGSFDVKQRLGCLGCPIAGKRARIKDFLKYPKLVRAYIRAGRVYLQTHPDSKTAQRYKDVYEYFTRNLFYDSQTAWDDSRNGMFENDIDYKAFLERYFNVEL